MGIVFFHRASSSYKRIVLGTLTILYGTTMGQALLSWYFIVNTFCTNGDSRLSIFIDSAQGVSSSPTLSLMSLLLQSIGYLFADGLMVRARFISPYLCLYKSLLQLWRCVHVCGQSFLCLALPMILGTIEVGMSHDCHDQISIVTLCISPCNSQRSI